MTSTENVYDTLHPAAAHPLFGRLMAEAGGEDHPREVDPFSSCTWRTLGRAVAALRLAPGDTLVDLGCGRGGVGLWLARATSARLTGVDFSQEAVAIATGRAADFVPDGRARFQLGTFAATGLPDAVADGVISVDALPFAPDRDAALAEVRRVLRPGARAVLTAVEATDATEVEANPLRWTEERWRDGITAAGLDLEERTVEPGVHDQWRRVYANWLAHEADLRAAVGDPATDLLVEEANSAASIYRRTPILLVLRRPA